jgi:hypothetical protein
MTGSGASLSFAYRPKFEIGVRTGPANASLMTSIGRSWLLPAGRDIGSGFAMISAPRADGRALLTVLISFLLVRTGEAYAKGGRNRETVPSLRARCVFAAPQQQGDQDGAAMAYRRNPGIEFEFLFLQQENE